MDWNDNFKKTVKTAQGIDVDIASLSKNACITRQPLYPQGVLAAGINNSELSKARRKTISNPAAAVIGNSTANYIGIINQNNFQFAQYANTISIEQAKLNAAIKSFVDEKLAAGVTKASELRNRSNWSSTKGLAVRAEYMKAQMGGKNTLPFPDMTKKDLGNIDFSNMNDPKVKAMINGKLKIDEQTYIDALKDFKNNGTISEYIQPSKAEALSEELKNIDLEHITGKDFKRIKANYLEKTEVHHRTGVASDPYQQSNIDNLDVVNTTEHQEKHFDTETGKTNFRKPVNEKPLNREDELYKLNKKRNTKVTLSGIGIAAAIGLGTGFTIGFLASLAQNGLNPNSLKYAFTNGAKQGGAGMVSSAGSAAIGLTIGKNITDAITKKIVGSIAVKSVENVEKMVNIGVVGSLTVIAFSIYEFAKLKRMGYSTKESLIRVGKSTALSMALIVLSVVAQGIWGGPAGMAVSIVAGIFVTGYSLTKIIMDKETSKRITHYTIDLTRPSFV